jgi:hypothetical protein
VSKAFSRFEPTPSRSAEECERHYTEVHVRMAQDLLRPMQGLHSYHTNRAIAQADISGGWARRPRAWRFVVLRFAPGAALAFTEEQNEMVASDHVNCLYRLRHCDVDETVLMDPIGSRLGSAKFLIEADRAPTAGVEEAWGAFAGLGARIHGLMRSAFGARCLIVNRALNEVACEPIDVEGQRPVGMLEQTTRLGYIEAYFDHPRWGREALAGLASDDALRHPALAGVNLLQVEESAALDMR